MTGSRQCRDALKSLKTVREVAEKQHEERRSLKGASKDNAPSTHCLALRRKGM